MRERGGPQVRRCHRSDLVPWLGVDSRSVRPGVFFWSRAVVVLAMLRLRLLVSVPLLPVCRRPLQRPSGDDEIFPTFYGALSTLASSVQFEFLFLPG